MLAHEISDLPHQSKPDLLLRYAELTAELYGVHMELASVLAEEKRASVMGWAESHADSVRGRDRDADYRALPAATAAIDLRQRLYANEAVRDLIRHLVAAGS